MFITILVALLAIGLYFLNSPTYRNRTLSKVEEYIVQDKYHKTSFKQEGTAIVMRYCRLITALHVAILFSLSLMLAKEAYGALVSKEIFKLSLLILCYFGSIISAINSESCTLSNHVLKQPEGKASEIRYILTPSGNLKMINTRSLIAHLLFLLTYWNL